MRISHAPRQRRRLPLVPRARLAPVRRGGQGAALGGHEYGRAGTEERAGKDGLPEFLAGSGNGQPHGGPRPHVAAVDRHHAGGRPVRHDHRRQPRLEQDPRAPGSRIAGHGLHQPRASRRPHGGPAGFVAPGPRRTHLAHGKPLPAPRWRLPLDILDGRAGAKADPRHRPRRHR